MSKFEEYLEAVRSVVEEEMIGEGNSKAMALINKMKSGPMSYREIQKFLYGSDDAGRGSNSSNITKLVNAGTIKKRADGKYELTSVGQSTSKPYKGDGKGDNWNPTMFRGREDYKKKSMKGESLDELEDESFDELYEGKAESDAEGRKEIISAYKASKKSSKIKKIVENKGRGVVFYTDLPNGGGGYRNAKANNPQDEKYSIVIRWNNNRNGYEVRGSGIDYVGKNNYSSKLSMNKQTTFKTPEEAVQVMITSLNKKK
jgi:hypothetical protein